MRALAHLLMQLKRLFVELHGGTRAPVSRKEPASLPRGRSRHRVLVNQQRLLATECKIIRQRGPMEASTGNDDGSVL